MAVNHIVTHDQVQSRVVLDVDTTLHFELPIKVEWFNPGFLNIACQSVSCGIGKGKICISPPVSYLSQQFSIRTYHDPECINPNQMKLQLMAALGMKATVKRVTRGWYSCWTCLERDVKHFYSFGPHVTAPCYFCPACATEMIASEFSADGKKVFTAGNITEILEVI
jgi:hypothetical protein